MTHTKNNIQVLLLMFFFFLYKEKQKKKTRRKTKSQEQKREKTKQKKKEEKKERKKKQQGGNETTPVATNNTINTGASSSRTGISTSSHYHLSYPQPGVVVGCPLQLCDIPLKAGFPKLLESWTDSAEGRKGANPCSNRWLLSGSPSITSPVTIEAART